jgi:hypothetical protein
MLVFVELKGARITDLVSAFFSIDAFFTSFSSRNGSVS